MQTELNRAQGQPRYAELPGNGGAAEDAAAAWAAERARHDSPVDDCFGGQLRSCVTCRRCSGTSYCFDYFLDLSLPLPSGRAPMATLEVTRLSFHWSVGLSLPYMKMKRLSSRDKGPGINVDDRQTEMCSTCTATAQSYPIR
jgi:hypothetical protein